MANGHGGERAGAGRPKGSRDSKTKKEMTTSQASSARLARKVYKDANPDERGAPPDADNMVAAADFHTMQTWAIVLAARAAGDYKAALYGIAMINDRSFGRVKQQIEHGEMDGSDGFMLKVIHTNDRDSHHPARRAVRAVANRRSVAGNGRRARKKVGKNLLRKSVRVRPNDKGNGSDR